MIEQCPVCSVKIENDSVLFSCGSPGTRAKLWARVCRFNKKEGCINQFNPEVDTVKRSDYYG